MWPLSPSFDTVGPMARDVSGLVLGMELLEPGFTVAPSPGADLVVGRLRPPADPLIDAAVDDALSRTEWDWRDLDVPDWDRATRDAGLLLVVEAWESNRVLAARDPAGIGADVRERLQMGSACDAATIERARDGQRRWQATLNELFTRVDFLVTPTLTIFPPELDQGSELLIARCTIPVNLAGVPALSLPVPTGGPLPGSLQLIGPPRSEERLLAAGRWLESAAAAATVTGASGGLTWRPAGPVVGHQRPADVGQLQPHTLGPQHLDGVGETGQLAGQHLGGLPPDLDVDPAIDRTIDRPSLPPVTRSTIRVPKT